jgi:hypothetical protein
MGPLDHLVLLAKNVYDNWEAVLEYIHESFAHVACPLLEKPLH